MNALTWTTKLPEIPRENHTYNEHSTRLNFNSCEEIGMWQVNSQIILGYFRPLNSHTLPTSVYDLTSLWLLGKSTWNIQA